MSKSIITLQLGNYSNFIGSHYWNLHEFSFKKPNNFIDNDVNYYEGLTVTNEITFTPKVLSWDWKENLGPRVVDDIYEEIESQGDTNAQTRRDFNSLKVNSYKGTIERHTGFTDEELKVNKSRQIAVENEYNEWNEYLYARFHPNSLTKLPKLYRELDKGNFRCFSQGLKLTDTNEFHECMIEQVRYFVEKCDVLQGFQMLCDSDDGFSGVGGNFLTHISDEYSKEVFSFPTNNINNDNINCVLNKVFLYNEMNSKSVIWSPISCCFNDKNNSKIEFANVKYNGQSKYHSSAILALALKSLLLPCFVNNGNYSISDFSSVIDRQNNKMASLALSLPFPLKENQTVESSLLNLKPSDIYSSLNPFIEKIDRFESVIGNVFGINENRFRNYDKQSNGIFDRCSNGSEMMDMFMNVNCLAKKSHFIRSVDKIQLGRPFPWIFSSDIDRFSGELLSSNDKQMMFWHCPKSIPLSTILFSNDNADCLIPIYETAKSAVKHNRVSSCILQIEPDLLTEALENFRDMI